MNEEQWATAIRVAARILGESHSAREDPFVTVQRLTQNVTPSGFPRETFSDKLTSIAAASAEYEAGTRSIEDLYGCYHPSTREIEIFIKRISADHSRFSSTASDLLTIVRLHEHAHAIVHLGAGSIDIENRLRTLNELGRTDWDQFLASRDAAFTAIDADTHELLAQAITWACISQRPEDRRLAEAFLALQERQSPRYRFDARTRLGALSADWPLVLKASRGEIVVHREQSFELVKGISALLAPPLDEFEQEPPSPSLMQFLTRVQESLAKADLPIQGTSSSREDRLELLLARRGCIELRMYKETAHQRPHFHIEYKKEFAASYALDTLQPLAGFIPRRYEDVMLPIARELRDELMAKWHALNGRLRVHLG